MNFIEFVESMKGWCNYSNDIINKRDLLINEAINNLSDLPFNDNVKFNSKYFKNHNRNKANKE